MNLGIEGRHALVLGGGGGIGRAVARALAQEGARVTVADVPGQLGDLDPGWDRQPFDLLDEPGVRAALVAADARSPLEMLVNAAGVFSRTPLPELDVAQFQRVLAVNLTGAFVACQEAVRLMLPRRRGVIVNVASLAGQVGGLVAGPDYAASKAGLIGFTKSLARYAGPHGIRVNVVNPGVVDTPMTEQWTPEAVAKVREDTPLHRIASAEEVGWVVAFLCSDHAGFLHGTHIDVNGGLYMD